MIVISFESIKLLQLSRRKHVVKPHKLCHMIFVTLIYLPSIACFSQQSLGSERCAHNLHLLKVCFLMIRTCSWYHGIFIFASWESRVHPRFCLHAGLMDFNEWYEKVGLKVENKLRITIIKVFSICADVLLLSSLCFSVFQTYFRVANERRIHFLVTQVNGMFHQYILVINIM